MTALFGPERKPWEDPADDRLAPSSYAAVAVFGIVELAVEQAKLCGLPLNAENVGNLSRIFARILIDAQVELGSGGGWASSLNTRLRGALRTALLVHAIPDEEFWTEWESNLNDTVFAIARTAAWLYAKNPQEI